MRMERSNSRFFQGALGGIIAGAVVAAWLFAVDFIAGEAFHTPGRLSAIVLGEEFTGPWPRHVFLFTQMHFGVFVLLGLGTNMFLHRTRLAPGLVPAAIFGIVVLNVVHYTGLLFTGTNLMTAVPVVHVVLANLLGGIAMMAYLKRAHAAEAARPAAQPTAGSPLRDGVITGIIGAAAVALWFFFQNLTTGEPFSTPSALGSALLLGVTDASDVNTGFGVIMAYSVLHAVVFLMIGITFSWVTSRIEGTAGFVLPAIGVLVLLEALFVGTAASMNSWVLEAIGWQVILIGNVIAGVAMGAWIWFRRPQLRERLLGNHQAA
jgi:hypothetical protein